MTTDKLDEEDEYTARENAMVDNEKDALYERITVLEAENAGPRAEVQALRWRVERLDSARRGLR